MLAGDPALGSAIIKDAPDEAPSTRETLNKAELLDYLQQRGEWAPIPITPRDSQVAAAPPAALAKAGTAGAAAVAAAAATAAAAQAAAGPSQLGSIVAGLAAQAAAKPKVALPYLSSLPLKLAVVSRKTWTQAVSSNRMNSEVNNMYCMRRNSILLLFYFCTWSCMAIQYPEVLMTCLLAASLLPSQGGSTIVW